MSASTNRTSRYPSGHHPSHNSLGPGLTSHSLPSHSSAKGFHQPSPLATIDDPLVENTVKRRGLLLILSSPSGAGKTTLSRRLLEFDSEVAMSISVTTRPRRPSEISGRDYDFVSVETFERMNGTGAFLEQAMVHGNHYGTPREPVIKAIDSGMDMLFDIDWQGANQLRAAMPDDVVSIFILPPSIGELERRLHGRAQDSMEVITSRLAAAQSEIAQWDKYDFVLVNQDIEVCLQEIQAILVSERHRRSRQIGLGDLVSTLLAGTGAA